MNLIKSHKVVTAVIAAGVIYSVAVVGAYNNSQTEQIEVVNKAVEVKEPKKSIEQVSEPKEVSKEIASPEPEPVAIETEPEVTLPAPTQVKSLDTMSISEIESKSFTSGCEASYMRATSLKMEYEAWNLWVREKLQTPSESTGVYMNSTTGTMVCIYGRTPEELLK